MGRRRKGKGSDLSGLFTAIGFLIAALATLADLIYGALSKKKSIPPYRTQTRDIPWANSPPVKISIKEASLKEASRPQDYSYRPPIRKHAKPEIDKFLNVKRKTKIIIFDLETNGFKGTDSVLSCAAIKMELDPVTYDMKELECFERYYFPVEKYNPRAIAVNGLTKEIVTSRRGDCEYHPHFAHDDGFEKFCEGVGRYVAHNISFDARFVPHVGKKKRFCTMMENTDIVATQYLEYKRQWKWPTLAETAAHYGISFSSGDLHASINDARITASIFSKMLETAKVN